MQQWLSAMNPIKALIKRFRRSEEGSILTEVALSLPIFIGILAGTVEVSNYLLLNLKLQHTVISVSDLVTRDEDITEDVITDIFAAVPIIMAPYTDEEDMITIISAVSQTEDDPASIFWQRSGAGTLTASSTLGEEGDLVNLDGITMRDNETVLATEVFFTYEPLVFSFLPEQTIRRIAYFRPRIGALQEIS
jgi:Flp pilus assembly protein TadG